MSSRFLLLTGVNGWLCDSVYKEYEAMMQTVEMELRAACVSYHKLPTRLLDYKPYCAFMKTYRMCMNDRGKAAYPTETEEKYLPLVVDGKMWTRVCAESQEETGFKNDKYSFSHRAINTCDLDTTGGETVT